MAMRNSTCKECSSPFHTAWYHKPRTTLKTNKPMSKVGRVGKATASAVAKWKKQTPSNHQGYWTCYICGRQVDYLMAEHVKSKVRNPQLRTELTNLMPTCGPCNAAKGSQDN